MDNKTSMITVSPERYNLGEVKIPSLKRRFGAFLIDILMMFLLSASVFVISAIATAIIRAVIGVDLSGMALIFIILCFVLLFGYFPLFEYFNRGQTIGRKIAGIRLVGYSEVDNNIHINYERIGPVKLILRNVFKLVWYFPEPVIFALIAFVLMYQDKLKRAFYDKVLKTIVIQDK